MKKRVSYHLLAVVLAAAVSAVLASGCAGPVSKEQGSAMGTEAGSEAAGALDITDGETVPEPGTEGSRETAKEGGAERETFSHPAMERDEFPILDGSTATIPLSIGLYQVVTGATEEEARGAVSHTKTDNSYKNLVEENSDLVLAYEPSADTLEYVESIQPILMKPIGKDALVFMANVSNRVKSLTAGQLVDIYSGKIRNWSEVGGASLAIEAFQRPYGSGSQTMMEKLVMQGVTMDDAPSVKSYGEMGELIDGVAAYNNQGNALGYSVYFYAKNMYDKPGLRFMAVDGVMPDNATIKNGRYPYVNQFYAAIRKDEPEDSNARKLFDWLTKSDGQLFVESMGYVGTGAVTAEDAPLFENPVTEENMHLPLDENQRLLLNGSLVGDDGDHLLLDKDMNRENLPGKLSFTNYRANIIDIREPQIVMDMESGKIGVYLIGEKKWLLEPVFENLWKEDDYYRGDREDGTRLWMDKDCRTIAEGSAFLFDDRVWKELEDGHFQITDYEGNVIKEMNLAGEGQWYVYQVYQHMTARYGDEFKVYDQDGNVIFNSVDIPEEYRQGQLKYSRLYPSVAGESWMSIHLGDRKIIYDFDEKRFITGVEDEVEILADQENIFYKISGPDGIFLYNEVGEKMVSPSGQPYTLLVGDGWLGLETGEREITVEHPESGRFYTLQYDLPDLYRIWTLPGDRFVVTGDSGEFELFLKGKKVMTGGYLYTTREGDYHIVSAYNDAELREPDETVVLDKDGNVVYTSLPEDNLLTVADDIVVFYRGNYVYVSDWDGNVAYCSLSGHMMDD